MSHEHPRFRWPYSRRCTHHNHQSSPYNVTVNQTVTTTYHHRFPFSVYTTLFSLFWVVFHLRRCLIVFLFYLIFMLIFTFEWLRILSFFLMKLELDEKEVILRWEDTEREHDGEKRDMLFGFLFSFILFLLFWSFLFYFFFYLIDLSCFSIILGVRFKKITEKRSVWQSFIFRNCRLNFFDFFKFLFFFLFLQLMNLILIKIE